MGDSPSRCGVGRRRNHRWVKRSIQNPNTCRNNNGQYACSMQSFMEIFLQKNYYMTLGYLHPLQPTLTPLALSRSQKAILALSWVLLSSIAAGVRAIAMSLFCIYFFCSEEGRAYLPLTSLSKAKWSHISYSSKIKLRYINTMLHREGFGHFGQ